MLPETSSVLSFLSPTPSLHCITVPLRANGAPVMLATDVMTELDTLVGYTVMWSTSGLGWFTGTALEKVLVLPPTIHTSVPVSVTHVSVKSPPAQRFTILVFG